MPVTIKQRNIKYRHIENRNSSQNKKEEVQLNFLPGKGTSLLTRVYIISQLFLPRKAFFSRKSHIFSFAYSFIQILRMDHLVVRFFLLYRVKNLVISSGTMSSEQLFLNFKRLHLSFVILLLSNQFV